MAMSILRQPIRTSLKRTYSTTRPFVPPAALRDIDNAPRQRTKPRPESPTFYTARSPYYDQLNSLESAIQYSRSALTKFQLLPLPAFARDSLPHLHPVWMDKREMGDALSSKLTTSRYRRVTQLLNELNDHRRIAHAAGCEDLGEGIESIVKLFEKKNQEAILARGKRKPVKFDKYGRSYTLGKRKTSAARVWIIPIAKPSAVPQGQSQTPEEQQPDKLDLTLTGLEDVFSDPKAKPTIPVTPATVLVNNVPLAHYFPIPADRERVIRPLKLTGLLGAYNVFAIVRGGGVSGQSGAVAHGIAKGLAAHEPAIEMILRKAKLMRRDPRMVERKKTGMAKARKRYTWVKR
ncbi:hypothetical protein SERLA73DRAFT_88269 [Serpula lacrymans var. lacrymans S7.3]|uniref:Ribosomal protein S5 domain 2-like protein n=2 Tax=Serpula lacrymans var. lacrymans TaxID=341189 RepID=F8PUG4_SERL3|nr:uncharacterized protein SERLADRAFT_465113 [Serpula lacrymans var. lacrymans S7.9]EGN99684.1 hypothetical protein SERLA73DRAFT_88269 [Serpula lacrymans var. lacrymans S7.3]EGO25244.1 hypothetical protein SERLADRAFT_465113 [Serpula lacrymans var. lacrymans S7.9]